MLKKMDHHHRVKVAVSVFVAVATLATFFHATVGMAACLAANMYWIWAE